jgi:hypothetical protein
MQEIVWGPRLQTDAAAASSAEWSKPGESENRTVHTRTEQADQVSQWGPQGMEDTRQASAEKRGARIHRAKLRDGAAVLSVPADSFARAKGEEGIGPLRSVP